MAAKEPKVGSPAWWADIRGDKPQAAKRTSAPTTKKEAPSRKASRKSSGREGINVPQFCPVTGRELRPLFVAKKGASIKMSSFKVPSKEQAVKEKKAALKKALAAPTKPTTCRDSVDAFGAAFGLYLETSSPAALAKAKAAQAKALSCGEKPSTLRDWANEIGDRVMEDEWVDMRGKFWMPPSKR